MYARPKTLDEALETLARINGTVLSGGTDLFPALTDQVLKGVVVDISAIEELRGIQVTREHIEIGGRTTWSEIVKASLPSGLDGLKAAAREVGSVQIQNQATVAGNICNASPAADGVVALMALDAEVVLASTSGERTLALTEFVLGNRKTQRRADEILTRVRIPRRLENAASSFLKLGARRYLVISIVMAAVTLIRDANGNIAEALICVGSCAPKAVRLRALEQALSGKPGRNGLPLTVRAEHFAGLSPIDDLRGTAAYRFEAARVLVQRALKECAGNVG